MNTVVFVVKIVQRSYLPFILEHFCQLINSFLYISVPCKKVSERLSALHLNRSKTSLNANDRHKIMSLPENDDSGDHCEDDGDEGARDDDGGAVERVLERVGADDGADGVGAGVQVAVVRGVQPGGPGGRGEVEQRRGRVVVGHHQELLQKKMRNMFWFFLFLSDPWHNN